MRLFLIRLVYFFGLFWAVNLLLLYVLPYAYGNKLYLDKVQNCSSKNVNTVFFGSSRLYRHAAPKIIDSILKEKNIISYNLATRGCYNSQTYYLYENFLENETNSKIKYALVELQPIGQIPSTSSNLNESNYFLSLGNYKYYSQYVTNSGKSTSDKKRYITNATKAGLNRIFSLKKIKYYIQRMSKNSSNRILDQNGFLSVSSEKFTGEFKTRFENFLKDTTSLNSRILAAKRSSNNITHYNIAHLKRAKYLIEKSERLGIELIFVIPPRLPDYKEIWSVADRLPQENIIDLSSPDLFPELYNSKYSFDIGHFNKEGASVFSTILAKKLASRLNN